MLRKETHNCKKKNSYMYLSVISAIKCKHIHVANMAFTIINEGSLAMSRPLVIIQLP